MTVNFKLVLEILDDTLQRGIKKPSYNPDDINYLTHRSLYYLKQGLFKLALKDAEDALQLNETDEKAIASKIQTLWGLNQFQKALDYIISFDPSNYSADTDYTKLLEKAQTHLKQSNGEYDMLEIYGLPKNQCNNLAEFTSGPIEILQILNKGRGLVATSDISPGQLILVCKAFAVAFGHKRGQNAEEKTMQNLIETCCHKLSKNPNLREEFCILYSGIINSNPKWIMNHKEGEEFKPEMVIEVKNRVLNNSFTCGSNSDTKPKSYGVWILPSYFNHSCIDANVHWSCYGDIMIARAFKQIAKGEELTICYFDLVDPNRCENICSTRKFSCDCSLCNFELYEKVEIENGVEKTMKSIKTGLRMLNLNPKKDSISKLYTQVKELISLRKEEKSGLNMALLDPTIEEVAVLLYDKKKFEESVEVFKNIRSASNNAACVFRMVEQDMNIALCYLGMKDCPEEVQKWVKILKQDLIICYGTIDMIKKVGHKFLKELKSQKIDFFKN